MEQNTDNHTISSSQRPGKEHMQFDRQAEEELPKSKQSKRNLKSVVAISDSDSDSGGRNWNRMFSNEECIGSPSRKYSGEVSLSHA